MRRNPPTGAVSSSHSPLQWSNSPILDDPGSTFEILDRTPRLHPDRAVVDAGFNGFFIAGSELQLFDWRSGCWAPVAYLGDLPESAWVRFTDENGGFWAFVEIQQRNDRRFGRWLRLDGSLFVPHYSRRSALVAEPRAE
jgi:hypothetical protein